ncbi:MarR family transcriptional regulator [Proteiniborus sp. DW1]|uniref:MarR family winged helix-turn-helix transcriptional regulator n=1 Tax=Proteiniborus sp. DW1 TaxID=1889883 RepID=UPI00092E186C|nr:MarR family transcriptional regulator [Proteiniborus sp. DW1]SCG84303.1 MarR family transcriptional regulator [Proteiniborus sp. DW1]
MIETDVAMQLRETYQKITQILQHKVDEYGLTFGLLFLTMLIDKKPDASQKELAKIMRFTEGAMSGAVKRLINLKMIEQVPLESDMRYNRLVVTELGKSMIDDYRDYVVKIYQDMFKGFSQEELSKLNEVLAKLNHNLTNMDIHNDLDDIIE